MLQVNPYFSLGKGNEQETINYIDYSTLTVNNDEVEIDNKEGVNTLFIPESAASDIEGTSLNIKLKNLIPCKVIIHLENTNGNFDEKYIYIWNFKKSNIKSSPYYDDIYIISVDTTCTETEENYISYGNNYEANMIFSYEMEEVKYKNNGILESKYLVTAECYKEYCF